MLKQIIRILILLAIIPCCFAAVFPLPKAGNDIVGQVQNIVVQPGDTFASIAEKYEVTYAGMMEANPNVDPNNLTPGTVLIIPGAYVLPNVPHKGIVINIAELRLYYFPVKENVVYTYPVGIGTWGWTIPEGKLKIVEKQANPTWYVPDAVYKELTAKGYDIPHVIGPGKDNPLGDYMMRLSAWTYLIHGVQDPTTVGRRSSSGCFRMYPEDIKALFTMTPVGTPVQIINQPYKVGWQNGQLYMEAHMPLQEQQVANADENSAVVDAVSDSIKNLAADVNWDKAFITAQQGLGLPQAIGQTG